MNNLFSIRTAVGGGVLIVALALGFTTWRQEHKSVEALAAVTPAAGEKKITQMINPSAAAPAAEAAAGDNSATAVLDADGNKTPWSTRCQNMPGADGQPVRQHCEAFQRLSYVPKDGDKTKIQRVMEMAIGFMPDGGKKARAVMVLPLGINVQKDVDLQIDDKDVLSYKIRFCDAGGCVGLLELDAGQIKKLRAGHKLGIQAELAMSDKKLSLQISLEGLDAALEKVKPKA